MNPLASHWLRVSLALFVLAPVVAFLVALTSEANFRFALAITLYVVILVCGILAVIAFAALAVRLIGRGMRAFRR